ncbi:DeoR/GlpR family DNA-binding transcription regulator [Clostridium baratii]|uniref:DeoR/GlpR family DNA-binding transcription regulator n=1 Tax=Clostridium baratii TaxID=1561 RepID=UPI00097FBA35|nr:DeoR/GlpR family DNA-binding transcription regulator [Clostridium baratii]AQM59718.1 DeoR family transcriptional regulator [Clostridium baratii]
MSKQDRLMEITDIIQTKKRISIKDLANATFCSISTIRRDIIFLEKQGLVKRLHGEIMLNNFNTTEPSQFLRASENIIKKKAIASLAKDFIAPGMCIYLDSSTTTYELCQFLCDIEHLIIFTNGLNAALKLAEYGNPTMKIFITGGEVKHYSSSVVNLDIENSLLNHFNVDLAFCSARGIDELNVYEVSLSQAVSKKRIIDKAKETILLIDSSKFETTGFFKINSLNKYKAIISDKLPNERILNAAKTLDIEWISSDEIY